MEYSVSDSRESQSMGMTAVKLSEPFCVAKYSLSKLFVFVFVYGSDWAVFQFSAFVHANVEVICIQVQLARPKSVEFQFGTKIKISLRTKIFRLKHSFEIMGICLSEIR